MYSYRVLALVFILLILLVVFSGSVNAQEIKNINVTGLSFSRSRSPLLNDSGAPFVHPAGTNFGSNKLGYFLLDDNNIGQNSVVKCQVNFSEPLEYLYEGSLVNSNNDLIYDVFFATATSQQFSVSELNELEKYIKLGGIVYVQTGTSDGVTYNDLFNKLDINVNYSTYESDVSTGDLTTVPLVNTKVINGHFENIGALRHTKFWRIVSSGVDIVFNNPLTGKTVLVESQVGRGYVSIAGAPLHVNILSSINNKKYFANFVSLGCKDGDDDTDVPLFKQGTYPYSDNNPS